ncbi:NUDIX domain-containing protein, partial [Streptomyces sp. NPDC044948]
FDKWVPPGGHIEPGESFAGTAVREFKEETHSRQRMRMRAPARA